MALTDKLTAIADAIRNKTGKSEGMTLDVMPAEINALTVEELISHADIPDYVKTATMDLAQKIKAVQEEDSITFLAMSDSHHYGEQGESGVDGYVDSNGTQTNESNLHSAMAAKILAYALHFDFMAHLGDASWGHKTTTSALLQSQVEDLFNLFRESNANIPCFCAIGNHDTGIYYHNQQIADGNSGVFTESGNTLFSTFTALSESENTVFGNNTYGGYCYRDFEAKKLRVFLLNTIERHIYDQTDSGMLGSQLLWFANALQELNNKEDAQQWGIILLSHYPADYGDTMPLSQLIKAYVEGSNTTISSEDGTTTTFDFSAGNDAKFIAQFHGHVHNFKYDKLSVYTGGVKMPYNAWRICIPNGQFNRENYYSTVGSYTDIDYSEETSYTKTAGTKDDTSFVVNVVVPSKQLIYSFCYGAGYDRTIGYAATVYYSISKTLKNATLSNSALAVEEGGSYLATVSANSGYDLTTVTITMGGEDITSSVYADGIIQIPKVTGNIEITATAVVHTDYTNQIPISTDAEGNIYNGTGYKAGYRLDGSGQENELSCMYVTGFIPCQYGDCIYLKNVTFQSGVDTSGNQRISFYDANKAYLSQVNATYASYLDAGSGYNYAQDENGVYTKITVGNMKDVDASQAAYFRICTLYIGADSVITVNEEITE